LLDICIKGGRIIDPAAGRDEIGTVGIKGNRIVDSGPDNQAEYVVDATGCLVVPGLIDFHAHLFNGGSSHGIIPDMLVSNGVTAVNDAGTTGAANFESFYRSVVVQSAVRIFAGLNLYPMGQPGYGISEDLDPGKYPKKEIKKLIERYPTRIRSVKIRLGEEIVGENGLQYLKGAVSFCEELGLPLVVHASNPPCSAEELAAELRPNDVFCHCFHGKKNPIVDADGRILPGIQKARERGVLFDCCNGRSNFSCAVGREAISQNFYPDFISTDLIPDYWNQNGFAKSLPYIMSKYLTLGMPIYEVIRAVTATPAQWLDLPQIGTVQSGSLADVAIFRLVDAKADFIDNLGGHIQGNKLLKAQMTILNGQIVFSQIDF